MKNKTLQQTVTFKASPRQVYDMLMDSKKHQSLSGERAKISKKVGGKFIAWGSHISGINLVLKPGLQDRASLARHRLVAGPLLDRHLRHQESARRIEAQIHADRNSTPPVQWPLSRMDRNVLDSDAGNILDRNDQR
jgi:hypothetical protein